MTAALQVLRKDARQLAPFILALLALHAIFAATVIQRVMQGHMTEQLHMTQELTTLLIPLAWIFLIAMSVTADPLVSDNAFWLTHPCSRRSLLLAKLFFVAAFINLPWFISDCVILAVLKLPLPFPYLALRQLPFLSLLLLPAFLVAAFSRNLRQFTLFGFAVVLAFAGLSTIGIPDLRNFATAPFAFFAALLILLVLFLPLLFYLYRRRAPIPYRLLSIGAMALALLSIPSLSPRGILLIPKSVRNAKTFPWTSVHAEIAQPSKDDSDRTCNVPINLSGLPYGTRIEGEGLTRGLGNERDVKTSLWDNRGQYQLSFAPKGAIAKRLYSFETKLNVIVFERTVATKIWRTNHLFAVPGVGSCRFSAVEHEADCWAGPWPTSDGIWDGTRYLGWSRPYYGGSQIGAPLIFGLNPVEQFLNVKQGTTLFALKATGAAQIVIRAQKYPFAGCVIEDSEIYF